jgi:hypothetical protein
MSLSDAHYFEEMGVKKYEEIRHTFSKVYECVPDFLALSHPHTFSSSYFFMVTLDSKCTRELTFQKSCDRPLLDSRDKKDKLEGMKRLKPLKEAFKPERSV